ncbi:hypothetical protein RKD47_000522 [Streptomyces albogriseolus]
MTRIVGFLVAVAGLNRIRTRTMFGILEVQDVVIGVLTIAGGIAAVFAGTRLSRLTGVPMTTPSACRKRAVVSTIAGWWKSACNGRTGGVRCLDRASKGRGEWTSGDGGASPAEQTEAVTRKRASVRRFPSGALRGDSDSRSWRHARDRRGVAA